MYPTNSLGYRWLRTSFDQTTLLPAPLPGPPIRLLWKCRKFIAFSPNGTKRQARALQNPVPTGPSCLFLICYY